MLAAHDAGRSRKKMKTVIIMQARSSSSRLPGKAMLPVGGYPSAALAALRAGNLGLETLVATSAEPSDDGLADVLTDVLGKHGIRVVRGPLEDVLARYALAVNELPEDSVVVRLTGDNVLPDGDLVRELVSAFAGSGMEYLSQDWPQSGLPFGLGGEAFTVSTLRRAQAMATSSHDREHVTPWIRRNCRMSMHVPQILRGADFGHLRCTIDDEEDYQRICRLFTGIADPVHARWFELVKKLSVLPGEPAFRVPYRVSSGTIRSELTLGTAQLGMKYGIANRAGQPARPLAIRMARLAIAHGVTALDTARAYGDAEAVLGEALTGAWRSRVEVITKLDLPDSLRDDAEESAVRAAVDASVRRSCEALRVEKLSTLLLHRSHHYRAWGGAVWRRLLEMRHEGTNHEGTIGTLGASVYEPQEALELLEDPAIRHLQIPMNVLDWRWKVNGVDRALADRPDVVVHARSALLQGLLASGAHASWPVSGEYDASSCLRRLRELAAEFGRESLTDLCLAYVRSQAWITSVVVGCETLEQLNENLRLFCLPKLTAAQCAELESSLPRAPESLLNPSQWKLVHERSAG
jgi:spore coat polysaccharide biosynthesis protein SpsF (cytidylyltransferase family)/aryl-alcohol dehydrogenase-like predicted oxidoreductase